MEKTIFSIQYIFSLLSRDSQEFAIFDENRKKEEQSLSMYIVTAPTKQDRSRSCGCAVSQGLVPTLGPSLLLQRGRVPASEFGLVLG